MAVCISPLAALAVCVACKSTPDPPKTTESAASSSSSSSSSSKTTSASSSSNTSETSSSAACPEPCGPGEVCVDDPGTCACAPDRVLCGSECVDLRGDNDHCGRCDARCETGDCANGLCGAPLPQGPSAPVVMVSGADTAASCVEVNEAKPERSINFVPGGPEYHAAFQRLSWPSPRGFFNWGDQGDSWDAALKQIPVDDAAPDALKLAAVSADPWTTTHGGSGLEYASFIGSTGPNLSCVAVGATDPAGLTSGAWKHPLACAHPAIDYTTDWRVDGPMIISDLGDDALYVSYIGLDLKAQRKRFRVIRYAPCDGVPRPDDSGGCPIDWDQFVVNSHTHNEHPNVAINPCTHHIYALYRETEDGVPERIRVAVVDTNGDKGDPPINFVLDDAVEWGFNTQCGGGSCGEDYEICTCGGPDGQDCLKGDVPTVACMDLAARVHANITYVPEDNSCRLHIAYDHFTAAGYAKVRMKTFDVTTDQFAPLHTLDSSPPDSSFNDFNGTVLADYFSSRLGVFFYRQEAGDPCATRYMGLLSDDGSDFELREVSDGSFPTVWFEGTGGIGHYVEGARFNEPGVLFPTWSQPVPSQAPCLSCQGMEYSLAVMGRRVIGP